MEKISLYERRRRLITVLYERQSDTIGNLAFEFSVSSHTIHNDIRVLELEYPIYTKFPLHSVAGFSVRIANKKFAWLHCKGFCGRSSIKNNIPLQSPVRYGGGVCFA